jgi:cobalt-zinc-cadmium efflux system protein
MSESVTPGHSHAHDHHVHDHTTSTHVHKGHSHAGHSHHGHHHGPAILPAHITRAFTVGIVLNSIFVITEVIALLTDAGHNLSDVASLALALIATRFALRKANNEYTFGYKQSTVLVALLNAGILLLALGAVAYEAVTRLVFTEAVNVGSKTVALVATAGIVINTITALLFMKGKDKDLNLRGAYLHMAADALVSLGVVIGGIVMLYTHWFWLDSVLSLIIVVVIVYGTWGLLKESLRLSMNGVPRDIDLKAIRRFLQNQKGISDVHDLHVWAMSTTENALTVHLVMPDLAPEDGFYKHIQDELRHHFHIEHSTIQVERGKSDHSCEQKC